MVFHRKSVFCEVIHRISRSCEVIHSRISTTERIVESTLKTGDFSRKYSTFSTVLRHILFVTMTNSRLARIRQILSQSV